jgi:hypothetical protein
MLPFLSRSSTPSSPYRMLRNLYAPNMTKQVGRHYSMKNKGTLERQMAAGYVPRPVEPPPKPGAAPPSKAAVSVPKASVIEMH